MINPYFDTDLNSNGRGLFSRNTSLVDDKIMLCFHLYNDKYNKQK